MTETSTKALLSAPIDFAKDINYQQLADMGIKLCKKCGSKQLTDENGELFCPSNDKACPLLA
jgi:uncharacterized Zn finger protein (UPF0148 family)